MNLTLQDRERGARISEDTPAWAGFSNCTSIGHSGLVAGAFFHLSYLSAVPLSHFHYCARVWDGSSRCKKSLEHRKRQHHAVGSERAGHDCSKCCASLCSQALLRRRTRRGGVVGEISSVWAVRKTRLFFLFPVQITFETPTCSDSVPGKEQTEHSTR